MNSKEIDYSTFGANCFPGFLGIEIIEVADKYAAARLPIHYRLFAPNGYLHAGSIVTLADTIAGYACIYNLPENGKSFTTMELKTNFLGTAKSGAIKAEAFLEHGGRTTQIWDVIVKNEETDKKIALFRCTQLILY